MKFAGPCSPPGHLTGKGGRGAYAQIKFLGISKEMVVLHDGHMTAETDHAVSKYWWPGGALVHEVSVYRLS